MADSYEIIDQSPVTIAMPGAQFEQGVQVTYKTKPSGIIDTVRIPRNQYTPDNVDRIVAAAAANDEAVRKL